MGRGRESGPCGEGEPCGLLREPIRVVASSQPEGSHASLVEGWDGMGRDGREQTAL